MMMMMMSLPLPCSSVLLLFVSLFLAFPSVTTSFDIAKVLAQNPSFSTFNNYLAQTQLASQINGRQTVTVLAVDNSAMSSINGKSMHTIKKVLSIHVLLDYFDQNKLRNLNTKSFQVTTLYQTTGQAINQEGFLNLTVGENGDVSFVSSSQQSNGPARSINFVASEPYDLSVIQVSSLLIPSTPISNPPAYSNLPSPSPTSQYSNSPSSPSPSPSSLFQGYSDSSSSPSSPLDSNSPAPSSQSHDSHSPSTLASPASVMSPVPVPTPVSGPSPIGSPNADSPGHSPAATNASGTAPEVTDKDAKSGASTNTGINRAFLILVTILGALHIHILAC